MSADRKDSTDSFDEERSDMVSVVLRQDPLGQLFSELTSRQRVDLLFAQLLLRNDARLTPDIVMRRMETLRYLLMIKERILLFITLVKGAQGADLLHWKTVLDQLRNRNGVARRKSTTIEMGPCIRFIDHCTQWIEHELCFLDSCVTVFDQFSTAIPQMVPARFADNEESHQQYVRNEHQYLQFEAAILGFLDILQTIKEEMQGFPKRCRNFAKNMEQLCQMLEMVYGKTEEAGIPDKKDVPFFRGHGLLTAFLDDCVERIPVLEYEEHDGRKDGTTPVFDERKIGFYAEYLDALADSPLLAVLSNTYTFTGFVPYVQNILLMYQAMDACIRDAGLQDPENGKPDASREKYQRMLQKTMEGGMGGSGTESLETFDLASIIRSSFQVDFSQVPTGVTRAGVSGVGEKSDRRQKLLDLFQQIFEKLQEVARSRHQNSAPECATQKHSATVLPVWTEFIRHAMLAKSQLVEQGKTAGLSQIRRDTAEGNYCYEPHILGVVGLDFRQVATTNITFDQVFGQSWENVLKKVRKMLETENLGFIYSVGAPRGRSRGNILLVGPPGCGKNEFSGAMSSDPRVVGVRMTTERLMTPYVGEAESNVRRLFELASAQRQRHSKAVVICWDEMDALFAMGRVDNIGTQIKKGMQKALQAVLDGDTVYDGVYLIGMTNEPNAIPVEVYRRFADVEVIQKLTDAERISLVQYFLKGLPLSSNFLEEVNWEQFTRQSNNASGDILGKIADRVFDLFLAVFREKHGRRLETINSELRQMVAQGEKVTAERKRELYARGTKVRVTPEMFNVAVTAVLTKEEIKKAMQYQVRFYDDVDRLFSAAFQCNPR